MTIRPFANLKYIVEKKAYQIQGRAFLKDVYRDRLS